MMNERMVELSEADELTQILTDSQQHPVVLFKHSLTCPISARAYREVESFLSDQTDDDVAYRIIVVQHARPISDAVARQLGVEHESPQVIIVRNGQPVWHASHFQISKDELSKSVQLAKQDSVHQSQE